MCLFFIYCVGQQLPEFPPKAEVGGVGGEYPSASASHWPAPAGGSRPGEAGPQNTERGKGNGKGKGKARDGSERRQAQDQHNEGDSVVERMISFCFLWFLRL